MKSKKKKIVFDDTDIRHAKLKIRLGQDNLSQAEFFRAIVSGYLEKDKDIIKFISAYKEENNIQSKTNLKKLENDYERADNQMEKFGIKDEELENIFDIIAKQYPDL